MITFGLLVAILLINNWSLPLWDQDESAYAGFAKNMNQSGDYLVPDYYFSDDHRKTPLHFWDISVAYRIFGLNEFSVRFPSFLAILGTLLLVLYQGKKIIGLRAAFQSTVILGTSFLVTSLAKISVTDATLLFFSTLCGFAMINIILNPSKKWVFYFWLGFALALLTKGPPIIIFTGIFAVMLFLFHPNRYNLFKFHPWFFLPLALVPVFLWGYATTLRDDGKFLEWMYDWYVLKRVSGSVYDQEGVFGTHIVLIFGFFLLSAMYFFHAFRDSFKGFAIKDFTLIAIGGWFISGWFFYEFSPSKLPAYVVVAHVPLALLMGRYVDALISKNTRPPIWTMFIHYVLNFGFAVGLIIAQYFVEINTNLSIALMTVGILYFLFLVIQIIRIKNSSFFNIQSYTNVFLLLSIWAIAPLFVEHINSSKKVSEFVLQKTETTTTIVIAYAPGSQPSLPFYLSERDNPIVFINNNDSLISYIENHQKLALVLNKEQSEIIKNTFPEYNIDFKIISSRIIDRKEVAEYYVGILKEEF